MCDGYPHCTWFIYENHVRWVMPHNTSFSSQMFTFFSKFCNFLLQLWLFSILVKQHASLLHVLENEYQVQNAQSLNCFHELHECFYFSNKGIYYSLLNTEKHTPSHLMITIGHTTYLVTVHNQSKILTSGRHTYMPMPFILYAITY